MLVSAELLEELAGVDILHFNASFFEALNNDASTPLRAADHDPVEGRFLFELDDDDESDGEHEGDKDHENKEDKEENDD
jgi:hypothetical protein